MNELIGRFAGIEKSCFSLDMKGKRKVGKNSGVFLNIYKKSRDTLISTRQKFSIKTPHYLSTLITLEFYSTVYLFFVAR